MTTIHADACVIGSGAGGGPVARELAEGGMSVVVLEEGRRFGREELTARVREMMPLLYRDAGQTLTEGNVPIVLPLGRGVGGTTLVNSGTCFRTPDRVLEHWCDDHGLEALAPERMRPHFEHVERETGVARVTPELAGRNAAVVKRGADALGWSGDYLERNARGCVGSGVCAFGCPTGAKQHAGQVWIAAAEAAGARTVTGARARRIAIRRGRARAVRAQRQDGSGIEVRADLVVVACGAVHTPLLLRHSRLGARSGELGRNLAIHPCTAVRAVFDEDIGMADGVPQSYFVDEFAPEGIMLEGAAGPPDYLAASLPFSRERLRELMLRFGQLSQFGLMISDRSRGEVGERVGRPRIRYHLGGHDLARVRRGIEKLTELYWAAGARTVLQPVAGVPPLHDGDPGPLGRGRRLEARDLTLMAFHPLGTARAHRHPARGVVDQDLKLHGLEGLYVSDASVIPTALGVNPQITIMALAHRLGRRLLAALARPRWLTAHPRRYGRRRAGRACDQDPPHPQGLRGGSGGAGRARGAARAGSVGAQPPLDRAVAVPRAGPRGARPAQGGRRARGRQAGPRADPRRGVGGPERRPGRGRGGPVRGGERRVHRPAGGTRPRTGLLLAHSRGAADCAGQGSGRGPRRRASAGPPAPGHAAPGAAPARAPASAPTRASCHSLSAVISRAADLAEAGAARSTSSWSAPAPPVPASPSTPPPAACAWP